MTDTNDEPRPIAAVEVRDEGNAGMVGALALAVNCAYPYLRPLLGGLQGKGHYKGMSTYGYQVAYSHYQDDLEVGEVEADSDIEADEKIFQQCIALTYRLTRELPIVASIEKWEIPERTYHLDLESDAEDLDVEEVGA